ncbi:hypothetical protein UPYG_G00308250 [Umbra pygmaea]|uniref:Spindle and kinetochore-associated protein 3 n=1 Tax=Umbra pygmaea TaxID=75934 RepID=A0ABD0VYY7_UMBPY
MDPSARFFGKLRNLAINLETETASLQQEYQNDNADRSINGAVGVLHELNSEVRSLKGQVKKQLQLQHTEISEVRSFIANCMVLKQRTTEDIQRLRTHFEKYGYKEPEDTQKSTGPTGQVTDILGEAGEGAQFAGEDRQLSPMTSPKIPHLPSVDPLRTPQLSDFGLSEIHLKRAFGGSPLSYNEIPTPIMTFPQPSVVQAMQLPMPKTPKCTLRMDEDDVDLQTPRMVDFGLSENTVCLNNDFTMDLQRRKPPKPLGTSGSSGLEVMSQRPAHDLSTPPSNSIMDEATTESIRPLVSNSQTTPELPAFQTPYINRLLGSRKGEKDAQLDEEHPIFNTGSKDNPTQEMPNLQSFLGNSLPFNTGDGASLTGMEIGEPPVLDLDGPTQTFNLGTPHLRGHCSEPTTPEMPDLSSVTLDIFKLISHTKELPTAIIQPTMKQSNIAVGKENRAQSLAVVSEMEFLNLPRYLRQIPLSSLNQAIQKINRAVEDEVLGGAVEPAGFLKEELINIVGVGTKARIYIVCLTELKRLELVQGGTGAVYKVLPQTHV